MEDNFARKTTKNPHVSCNPKVSYRIHKNSTLVSVLSQTNSLQSISFGFFKIRSHFISLHAYVFQAVFLLRVSPPKLGMYFSYLPRMPLAPLVSFSLISYT
jgi:hypothetical protein